MRYLSVCSGIEAATCAWHHMGWEAAGFSEIEAFPSAVLKHHYPNVQNLGDMTKFEEWNLGTIDLLVGGTPCQSFSVAGLRKGLDDPRGNLMLTYLAIARKFSPRWIVWENVPGVLSSNGGEDFAALLRGLDECGYGWAYRVLDAQYFGVAQRRRRVFVVGYLGNWHRAAAVLFDRESVSGNPAPSREKGQRTARSTQASSGVGCIGGLHPNAATGVELAPTLPSAMGMGGGHIPAVTARMTAFGQYESDDIASSMKARDHKDATDLVMQPVGVPEVMSTLLSSTAGVSRPGNAATEHETYIPMTQSYGIPGNWIGRSPENGGNAVEPMHDVSPCLTKTDQHGVAHPIHFRKSRRAQTADDCETWVQDGIANTLNCHDLGDIRAVDVVAQPIAFTSEQTPKVSSDLAHTLTNTTFKHNQMVAQPIAYSFDSLASNSMKSSNPISGCRETDIAKTLDTTVPEPSKNQGGTAVLQPIAFHPTQTPISNTDVTHAMGCGSSDGQASVAVAYGVGEKPDVAHCLRSGASKADKHESTTYVAQEVQPIPIDTMNHVGRGDNHSFGDFQPGAPSYTLTKGHSHAVATSMAVRRLTPRECERLQGFSDDYTLIPWRGKDLQDCPDGPRYKALGNSMAVPVMRWIGERIGFVDELPQ